MAEGTAEVAAEVTDAVEDGRGTEPDGWVPVAACTLPAADRPARLAEFDGLFSSSLAGLHREAPGRLLLRFDGGAEVARRARDLTAREARCCGFFDFTVSRSEDEVVVDVRVPADKETVLDGLSAQARAALAARE